MRKTIALFALCLATSAQALDYMEFCRMRAAACYGVSSFSPLDLSPVAWYKGDGNALDSVDGYHQTWVGSASYVSGVNGQAFSMDNSNYLKAGTNRFVRTGTQPITVCAWVNPASFSTVAGVTSQCLNHWVLALNNGVPRFYRYRTGNTFENVGHTSTVSTNEWHFVVGQYNSGTNYIWVDGVKSSAAASGDWVNSSASDPFSYIGKYSTATTVPQKIDDVLIFYSAITDAQIQQLYQWRQ